MSWREATVHDHPALTALSLALYAEDPSTVPMTREKIERTLTTLANEPIRGRAIVLDVDVHGTSTVGAYALLCAFWSNELGGEVCVVDELYVQPRWRGRGHATTLLEALIARRLPWFHSVMALELEVTPTNARARALYERLGFRAFKNTRLRRMQG